MAATLAATAGSTTEELMERMGYMSPGVADRLVLSKGMFASCSYALAPWRVEGEVGSPVTAVSLPGRRAAGGRPRGRP
jgi:hypothetical protein